MQETPTFRAPYTAIDIQIADLHHVLMMLRQPDAAKALASLRSTFPQIIAASSPERLSP